MMTSPELFFYDSVEAQAEYLSDTIAFALIDDVALQGEALLVLPGGTSPIALITRLAQKDLPWDKVLISVTDERCVPEESEYSNIGQIIRLFSEQGREINTVPLWDNKTASKANTNLLCWPATATVIGMGLDGHIASLFPDQQWSKGDEKVIDALAPFEPSRRVSLSMDMLALAKNLILLVNGDEKWDLYQHIEKAEYDGGTPLERLIKMMRYNLKAHVVALDK